MAFARCSEYANNGQQLLCYNLEMLNGNLPQKEYIVHLSSPQSCSSILWRGYLLGQWYSNWGPQMFLDCNSQKPSPLAVLARICARWSPGTSEESSLGTTAVETILTAALGVVNIQAALCYVKLGILFPAGYVVQQYWTISCLFEL